MKEVRKKLLEVRCEDIDSLEFENLLEEDLRDIEDFLDSYIVSNVEEYKIDSTIDVVRAYMPSEVEEIKSEKDNILGVVKSSFNLIKLQVGLINKLYWVLSLALILLGVISMSKINIDLIVCSSIVAPIPILLGVIEFIRGRNEEVWELELSYKYSLREILIAKLIIVISMSIVISFIMSLISANIYTQVNLINIISIWLIPICITASLSLFIVSVYRNINSIGVCIAIWIIGVNAIAVADISEFMINISNISMLVILGMSIISMILSLRLFYKRCINYKDYIKFDL